MNSTRRTFLKQLVLGTTTFAILPPATTYSRVWKATRRTEVSLGRTLYERWYAPAPTALNPTRPYHDFFVITGSTALVFKRDPEDETGFRLLPSPQVCVVPSDGRWLLGEKEGCL